MSHSSEPWEMAKVDGNYPGANYFIGTRSDFHKGTQLVVQTVAGTKRDEANAQRIVACINSCANLNPTAYRECLVALKRVTEEYARELGKEPHEWMPDYVTAAVIHAEGKE